MIGKKNEYNESNFQVYRKLAELGFALQRFDPHNIAVRALHLGEIGPNGLVRIHLRSRIHFIGEKAFVKDLIAQMFTIADDFSVSTAAMGSEVLLTFGVYSIVTNYEDDGTADCGWYNSLEEIV